MGVYHSFEKMKPQLCFFLKNPSIVYINPNFKFDVYVYIHVGLQYELLGYINQFKIQ